MQSLQLSQAEEEQIGSVHCLTRVAWISSLLRCPTAVVAGRKRTSRPKGSQAFAQHLVVRRFLIPRGGFATPLSVIGWMNPFWADRAPVLEGIGPAPYQSSALWASKGVPGCRRFGGAGWLTFFWGLVRLSRYWLVGVWE